MSPATNPGHRRLNPTALREFRVMQRLTQDTVAADAKTSGAYLSRLESGVQCNPSWLRLLAIAEALKVPVDAITYPVSDCEPSDISA